MDPLSIAASALTLTKAATIIYDTVTLLHKFNKARAEFCDLLNDLATLQAILHNVKSSLAHVLPIYTKLNLAAEELQELAHRLLSTSGGIGKDGLRQISKLQWYQERQTVSDLRNRIRSSREDLILCFEALQLSQGTYQLANILEMKQSVASGLTNTEASLHSMGYRLTSFESLLESKLDEMHNQSKLGHADTNSILCFDAKIFARCPTNCICKCHHRFTFNSPKWLRSILGTFAANYNSLPIIYPRAFNLSLTCESNSTSSIRVQYYLPSWLLARGAFTAVSWSSLTGVGASLHMRCPEIIPFGSKVWGIIRNGEVQQVYDLLRANKVSPNGVDDHGMSLVYYSLQAMQFEVTKVLISGGCNTTFECPLMGSSTTKAAYILTQAAIFDLQDSHRAILEKIADADGVPGSTPLHEAVLGSCNLPLDVALAMDTYALNQYDSSGMTPLHWAVQKQDREAVEFLLVFKFLHSRGARFNDIYEGGQNALHLAAQGAQHRLLEYLRAINISGIDPMGADELGRAPIDCLMRLENMDENEINCWIGRRPTRLDSLSFRILLIETCERNWGNGVFLQSREDLANMTVFTKQKAFVEHMWHEYAVAENANDEVKDKETLNKSQSDAEPRPLAVAIPRWLMESETRCSGESEITQKAEKGQETQSQDADDCDSSDDELFVDASEEYENDSQ
ncbi:ankyrin repeat-containing domain protein [Cladorrhinum sp. PSN332]|nr:ankyrin repeat-containing domain protein [Cladorrhinum sp. PSN332]